MVNKDCYKSVAVDKTILSNKIKKWAKKNGISSLYELIEVFQKRELDSLNETNLNAVSKNAIQLDNVTEFDNIVSLNDEDGNTVRFEFLDLIAYENREYVVLLPADEDADQVVILEVHESDSDNEETYISVTDEEILQLVFEIFKERFSEEFDFI